MPPNMAKTKAPVAVESEIRRFKIDPHAIMSLIKAQAGSIHKAMLEAVANSMDAGATRLDITVDRERIVIRDDGHGLANKEDIYRFFEVFGFDHAQLGRSVGRFGVGRGQLFCFGVNSWRTSNFEMSIDIKGKGLDYDLRSGLPQSKGMTITIDLYDPLLASEQLTIEEEFRTLVRFCTIPVVFNGKQLNEDPAKAKWTLETDEAWFFIRKDGRMDVYSQGLFVKPMWSLGVGGRIVTKPGFALEQNLARNDILEKECPVWKKLLPVIRKEANKHMAQASAKHDLTPQMRKFKATEALTPEGTAALLGEKLFTLTTGKHVNLSTLMSAPLVSLAQRGDLAADRFIQHKQAMVLEEQTLERFGSDTVTELFQRLTKALEQQRDLLKTTGQSVRVGRKTVVYYELNEALAQLATVRCYDDMAQMPLDSSVQYEQVKPKDMTAEEKAIVYALRHQMRVLAFIVEAHRNPEVKPWMLKVRERRLALLEDNKACAACTDGVSTIWLNRKVMVQHARKGLDGYVQLVNLLIHEYLHAEDSHGAHGHPPEFYEEFHDILIHRGVAHYAMSAFAISVRHGNKPTAKRVSMLEAIGVEVDTDLGTGLAMAEQVETDAARVGVDVVTFEGDKKKAPARRHRSTKAKTA